jgi:hypothetical protein
LKKVDCTPVSAGVRIGRRFPGENRRPNLPEPRTIGLAPSTDGSFAMRPQALRLCVDPGAARPSLHALTRISVPPMPDVRSSWNRPDRLV